MISQPPQTITSFARASNLLGRILITQKAASGLWDFEKGWPQDTGKSLSWPWSEVNFLVSKMERFVALCWAWGIVKIFWASGIEPPTIESWRNGSEMQSRRYCSCHHMLTSSISLIKTLCWINHPFETRKFGNQRTLIGRNPTAEKIELLPPVDLDRGRNGKNALLVVPSRRRIERNDPGDKYNKSRFKTSLRFVWNSSISLKQKYVVGSCSQ